MAIKGRHGYAPRGSRRGTAYQSWVAMRQRCRPRTTDKAADYASRGITVDLRWNSFTLFLEDMGERPEGHTLDRRDNAQGYTPDNCQWATPKQQAENRRSCVTYTHQGETLTSSEWSRRLGGGAELIRQRLRKGWLLTDALSSPYGNRKPQKKKPNG